MVREFRVADAPPVWTPRLDEELADALNGVYRGMCRDGGGVRVMLDDAATSEDEDTARATVLAHDHTQKSTAEVVAETMARLEAAAETTVEGVPAWARWEASQVEDYIEANVTDLASAKVVLKAMGKMVAAMRDKLWPHLQES